MSLFLATSGNARFHSRLMWRLRPARLCASSVRFRGSWCSADLRGIALFQIMTVRLGSVDGAATQIRDDADFDRLLARGGLRHERDDARRQSIGAGDKEWAMRLGNATIKLSVGYMALIGVFSPWPGRGSCAGSSARADSHAAEVVALGGTLCGSPRATRSSMA